MNASNMEVRYVTRLEIVHTIDHRLLGRASDPDRLRRLMIDEIAKSIAGELFEKLSATSETPYGERTDVVIDVLTRLPIARGSCPILVGAVKP